MTEADRKSLAEQLLSNPLFGELLDGIETSALEALVNADTEQTRIEAQWRVRSARAFRSDCESFTHSTRRKGVIA